ncbi:MAG: type II secretion system F family protein [Planctomycetaceae bacterium]
MLTQITTPVQLGILVVLGTIVILALARIIRKRQLARHDRLAENRGDTGSAQAGDRDPSDPAQQSAPHEATPKPATDRVATEGNTQDPEPQLQAPLTNDAAAIEKSNDGGSAHDNQTHPAESHATRSHLFTILQSDVSELNNVPELQADESPTADTTDYVLGGITPTLAAMLPQTDQRAREMRAELVTAGYYTPHAHINLAAIRYLCIIIPMFFCGFLLAIAPEPAEWWILVALIGLPTAGWAAPRIIVQNRGQLRKTEIEKALPDMLDMLNMCISQGLTMSESLGRIGQELRPVYPALAQELQITSEQARIGVLEQALLNLNDRIQLPEMQSFTSLLIQTERMGTSMVDSLTEYSDGMRTSLQQRADERGNKAAFKLLFPTVLCLMPAVYLFLLGPSIVAMSDFFTGTGSQSIQSTLDNVERLGRAQAQ